MKYKMNKGKKSVTILCIVFLLLTGLTSCGGNSISDLGDESLDSLLEKAEDLESTMDDAVASEDESDIASLFGENNNDESNAADENVIKALYDWPVEADEHGLNQPKDGYINAAGIYNGAISIGLAEITRDQVETYKNSLLDDGFLKNGNWPGFSMWNYAKEVNGIYSYVYLSYTAGTLSIIINEEESLEAFVPEQQPLSWNPSIPVKVPVFEYGTIIGAGTTTPMVMEYNGVVEEDFNAYLSSLEALGFVKNNTTYEYIDSESMEYITIDSMYEDGYVTFSIVGF